MSACRGSHTLAVVLENILVVKLISGHTPDHSAYVSLDWGAYDESHFWLWCG